MYKNPYEVLGLPKGAPRKDVEEAYETLRAKYRLDMHSEGAKGKAAAKMLEAVENAYADILTNYAEGGVKAPETVEYETFTDNGDDPNVEIVNNDYSEIERLLKNKCYSDAQRALDDIDARNAEWHYYQSVIYYKTGRMQESKAQLELACSMDPTNQRYKTSLEKLNAKMNGASNDAPNTYGNQNDGYHRSYYENDTARTTEDGCCAACQTLLCLNCMCDCCCR